MLLVVGHTVPQCGPPSMGQVQWRTATNPLHSYQMHEGLVGTFMNMIKKSKLYTQQQGLPQKVLSASLQKLQPRLQNNCLFPSPIQ